MRDLAALPLLYGVLVGIGFGAFEAFNSPQIIHKPAMMRYREGMGRAPLPENEKSAQKKEPEVDTQEKSK